MDLYLDDCADANSLVRALQDAGHHVRTPRSDGTLGIQDPDHLEHAAARGLTLITKNPDDFRQLHELWAGAGKTASRHPADLPGQQPVEGYGA